MLTELMWEPLIVANTPRTTPDPAYRWDSARDAVIASLVSATFSTTPLWTPRDGVMPAPRTFSSPSGPIRTRMEQILLVPMSTEL